ncbi:MULTISPECIES: flagellar protein FlaG [Campylobacter]|uniref:Flagellar biosynthesis protein FlaG n=2 Tax=Campylobacter lanienae TaxID=75658 RepID=A0ABY3G8I4_9BACT|nr:MULTISPECIES: flagellar protein FlaG [Campylobacter]ARQ97401.1 flagellar protein FlaG [Campylobacter lanienae NCTC 13004]MCI7363853.1 flagellar protein FlaG [Campylobacter lanienae]MDD5786604.1 flagellar protein FlaG [Campylobacter lanienae]TWO29292.1 flagellar biosynthesis protein FlaG [Campylobacter lanienae]
MEILKVAAQQQMDTYSTQNTQSQFNTQTREVENLNLQQDSATQNRANESLTNEQIQDILAKANENLSLLNTNIRFGYNDKIDSMFINVTEKDTGNIIRKIPTEQAMKLTEHFRDIIGMIFDKKE